VDGDSRSTVDKWYSGSPDFKETLALRNYTSGDTAVSGATVVDRITAFNASVVPQLWAGGANIVVIWGGVNGVFTYDAADIWGQLQTYCANARAAGFKVILCTEIDAQDAGRNATGWHTTTWPTLNALIRAGWASIADGLADLGADARLQDATDLTYFGADQVHPVAAGYEVIGQIIANTLLLV
jgi:lysophospholipase L1-like esterase